MERGRLELPVHTSPAMRAMCSRARSPGQLYPCHCGSGPDSLHVDFRVGTGSEGAAMARTRFSGDALGLCSVLAYAFITSEPQVSLLAIPTRDTCRVEAEGLQLLHGGQRQRHVKPLRACAPQPPPPAVATLHCRRHLQLRVACMPGGTVSSTSYHRARVNNLNMLLTTHNTR